MYAVSGARQQPLYEARSQAQIDQEKLDATIRTYVTTETPSDKTAFVRLVNRLVNNRGSYLIEPKDAGPDNFAEKLAKVKPFDREDVVSTFEDLTKPYDFRWWSSKDLGSIIAIIQEMTKEECKHFFDVAKSLFQTYPRVLNRSFATVQNLSQADADDWADIAFKYMYLISIPILNECPEIIPIIAKILKENRGKFISILESFALDRSAIHKIVAIAEALSKTPFEQWDDILEKVAALAPRTQNSPDVHLCIDAIGQVDPDLREATVKQVLRLESLRDGSDVAQIIQMLDRFDIQYRDRIVETALLLVPDRSPKKLICLMANTPKEIDELSQCALQIKENCYQIGDIEWFIQVFDGHKRSENIYGSSDLFDR